jgi:hypothetical protein
MNIWFYIFISYLILQGLISLLGSVAVNSNDYEQRPFFLIRVIRWVFYIIISPLWHFIMLISYMALIKKVAEYERFIQIGKE